jgi:type IV secretory pathway VirB9-like protein
MSMTATTLLRLRFAQRSMPALVGTIVSAITLFSLATVSTPSTAQSDRAKAIIAKIGINPADLPCSLVRERGRSSDSAIIAKPLPHDSRLVIFPYDKNALFPINTVFNRFTHFEFESGEKILASYINDDTEWEQKVAATGSDILVRPRIRGAVGSMTTITDRRRYQIDLLDVSACASESRYQRVSWQHSDAGFYEDKDAINRLGRGMTQGLPVSPADMVMTKPASVMGGEDSDRDTLQVNLEGMNADYIIEGDKELSPIMVLDDGKRTWLKFSASLALRPALFSVTAEGNAETVEYTPRGAYFIVPKVFSHGILLKLGKREVKIRNKNSNCGWFNSACSRVNPANVVGSH